MNSDASTHASNDARTREHVESLLDFVLLCEADRVAGGVRPVDEYQRKFPHIAESVAEEYARLTGDDPSTGFVPIGHAKPRIAHFVLERELGSGGQGRVYLATDSRMRRRVALKVLNRANLTPDKLRRFRREVEVIARLDHPGLCTVYEADLDAARPYLAMRFVDGRDLARRLTETRDERDLSTFIKPDGSPALAQLLHIFERTARALHAAHEAGVVHRDIKPANILVGENGDPVIVDFGLARGDDPELAGLTQTEDVIGTPAYMAPELLESGHSSADRRVDVYALGVALYECLTLRRPFRAEHREALFQNILRGEYEDPRELNALVNEDLRIVLATAMEHQPARRYATALEFAEDLRRIREYEPIRAQEASWILRTRRWSQRHPGIAAAVALLLGAACVYIGTLEHMLGEVEAQSRRAEAERDRTRAANATLLGVECREESAAQLAKDPALALILAIEADRRDPGLESNMAVLRALQQLHTKRAVWVGSSSLRGDLDVTHDGKRVLATTTRGEGLVFDLEADFAPVTSRQVALPPPYTHVSAGFSPDGQSFFLTDETPSVRVFRSTTGELLRTFAGHSTTVTSCSFSPDGRALLTSSHDGLVRIFDAQTAALKKTILAPTGYFTQAQFDATGSVVLTSKNSESNAPGNDMDNDPRVWDARTGELLATLRGSASPIRDACFSRDDAAVFAVEVDGIVHAWDWRSGSERWSAALPGDAWCVATSPDGTRVVAGFTSGVRVLDAASGAVAFDLSGLSERSVTALEISPDGRWIAAQDYGGGVGAWSAHDGARRFRTYAPRGAVSRIAWLPDSRRFFASSGRGHMHLWTIDSIPDLVNCAPHDGAVRSAVFDPASSTVLTAGADGNVRISSVRDGSPLHELDLHAGPLERAWFIEEGRKVASLSEAGSLLHVDLATAACTPVRRADGGSVTASALSPSGDHVCVGFDDGRVSWMETSTGAPIAGTDERSVAIRMIAISRDGERAAWGAADGWAGVLDRATKSGPAFNACQNAIHRPQVFTVAFTRGGAEVVTCGDHSGVQHWNARTGEFLGVSMTRPLGSLVELDSGSDLIVSAKWAPQVIRLTTVALATRWEVLQPGSNVSITSLRVSPNQQFVLTSTQGGVAELASTADGATIMRYEHGTSPLTCAEFSPDGRAVVTAAEDGTVRVWPVDVVGLARAHAPGSPDMWPNEVPREVDDP